MHKIASLFEYNLKMFSPTEGKATTELHIVWAEWLNSTFPIRRNESRKVEIPNIEVKKSFRNSTEQWRISSNTLCTTCI
jgi:hypothetical protein